MSPLLGALVLVLALLPAQAFTAPLRPRPAPSLCAEGFGSKPERKPAPAVAVPSIDSMLKANKERERAFSQLQFPTSFTVKVIGEADATFLADVLLAVERVTGQPSAAMQVSTRDRGRYLAVSLSPVFASVAQIEAVYEAVGADARVRYVL